MAISRDEVVHVARLARLALTDEELDRFAGQLDAILEAVGKVAELDLSDVEPTLNPLALSNVWAEDAPPGLGADAEPARALERRARGRAAPVADGRGGAGQRARAGGRRLPRPGGVTETMFHSRHRDVTDPRAGAGYGVCRGPGDPLGAVGGMRA